MSKVANSLALNLASFCRPWGQEGEKRGEQGSRCTGRVVWPRGGLTWLRVAEYSGLTGRKGTALRSVTSVLWFCVVSQTAGRHLVSEPRDTGAGLPRTSRLQGPQPAGRRRGRRASLLGLGVEPGQADGNRLPQPPSRAGVPP